ncbi:NAD(P)-dependent oxidoreductase [Candidatus Frankia alpina]|uniref:NAD-dependent epimerase/dehydratase family protein n=1 Tax=Candidatus Frankia alpina TaxID=2699483 RepID=A0A4V3Z7G9_9ACTN|nr:NAD(P)H-binding protein [Candidatus Frankia alpina]THJ74119.1 NAD-dependent epimerase/dehydratase family protein [Candidatus Frankia alpina]
MARIVIFGAGGQIGRRITDEAIRRGHEVTAVEVDAARVKKLPRKANGVEGDVTSRDSVQLLAQEADAVVVAVGGVDRPVHANAARTLVDVLPRIGDPAPAVLHISSGGTLEDENGQRLADSPDFPAAERKDALDQADTLDVYRDASNVRWAAIAPPPRNLGQGQRRGAYRTGNDRPVVDAQGEIGISYEDFAIAVIDEVEKPRNRNRRFTVGN